MSAFPCSIGIWKKTKCEHLTTDVAYTNFNEPSSTDQDLLIRRTGLPKKKFTATANLCYGHRRFYLSSYESRRKICCDPFERHSTVLHHGRKKSSVARLKILTSDHITHIFKCNKSAIPGQKICSHCYEYMCKEKGYTPSSKAVAGIAAMDTELSAPANTSRGLQAAARVLRPTRSSAAGSHRPRHRGRVVHLSASPLRPWTPTRSAKPSSKK